MKDDSISISDEPQYSHTIAATQGLTFNKPMDLTLHSDILMSSSDEDNSHSDSDTDLYISDKEY